ncbi:adenylate/guanylate cyclase domain-containing protein [Actinokineospora sp. NBRC 105648]|uniref:adenylate/guanylate cyclase domain-containing protein n=1 Tax=Actinokineospora sp. NBRC 105648 TaxID=3032206 RepID=UPI0024A0C121|nr:adenylate/guanylate cyclase domain-containing protein [Actinokineospora sp. NBRC 105648]GLZ42657.1 adenylate/guanylate cyclase domain-containing protein [Actinokineospora sp. NBRC 105648]
MAENDEDTLAAAQRRVEEVLLGGRREYTRGEVCAKAGVPLERAMSLWRALGFATVGDDEVVFTESDAETLRMTDELMSAGILEPELATATARMLGQHLSRLAEWEVDVLRGVLAANPELLTDERQLGRLVERLVPDLERMHNFAWRRHLAAYAGRALAAPGDIESRSQVVGFADMVGFTTRTRRADEAELVRLVDRFDLVTAEVVAENHGRIVKMLGDEVLFVVDDPEHGAEIALRLLERAAAEPELPALRAGLAYGRVLSRFGDVYGSVVNIASRLTSAARPGTVLVDKGLANALVDAAHFTTRSRRPVSVRGYSRLRHSVLRRAGTEPAGLVDLVQQRAADLLGLGVDEEEDEGMPSIELHPDDERRARKRRRR